MPFCDWVATFSTVFLKFLLYLLDFFFLVLKHVNNSLFLNSIRFILSSASGQLGFFYSLLWKWMYKTLLLVLLGIFRNEISGSSSIPVFKFYEEFLYCFIKAGPPCQQCTRVWNSPHNTSFFFLPL